MNFLFLQLESALKSGGGDVSTSVDPSAQGLVQQNIELRRKLEDEHSSYKRKLTAYQDGQQRQAQLVQKLQAKVNWLYFHPSVPQQTQQYTCISQLKLLEYIN